MYRAGPGFEADTTKFWSPLPNRVPGKNYSYSDHEAVAAVISVTKAAEELKRNQSGPDFRRSLSVKARNDVVGAVNDAGIIIDKSLKKVDFDKVKYTVYSFSGTNTT